MIQFSNTCVSYVLQFIWFSNGFFATPNTLTLTEDLTVWSFQGSITVGHFTRVKKSH